MEDTIAFDDAFLFFDLDNDKRLTFQEFSSFIRTIGYNPSDQQLEESFQDCLVTTQDVESRLVQKHIIEQRAIPFFHSCARVSKEELYRLWDPSWTGEDLLSILMSVGQNLSISDYHAFELQFIDNHDKNSTIESLLKNTVQ